MKAARKKRLRKILPKRSGRDNTGRIAVRHQAGRKKRMYRMIDWKREKDNVPAKVVAIEYDPNRSARIALLQYKDGEKRYILAPERLKVGQTIVSGNDVKIKVGNAMKLRSIPVGTVIHCLEIRPQSGAQMVRGAGNGATVLSKDGNDIQIKLPSGEIRLFRANCKATIGQIGNIDWKHRTVGTAGRNRRRGIKPTVRGVAQHPGSHPHGGGEGRSGIGMPSPKSPWGKRTLGKKTRKRKKYSNKYIIERRKK